jgi:hypothetical protein
MSHYESNRGCWMFKPPSAGKQGGLLAAINKLSKSWSKRWVWMTHDALHYAPKRPTNARSEDNVVKLETVLDVREVDAKFMTKKGVPQDVANYGWIIRTEKKDILWAAPDPDTRDRIVTFFAKYRAWSRIGQPSDEEDVIDFLRTQLFHERDADGFSETGSTHHGAQSSVAATDMDNEGMEYWDEMMAEGDDFYDRNEEAPNDRRNSALKTRSRSNTMISASEPVSNLSSPSRTATTESIASQSPRGDSRSQAPHVSISSSGGASSSRNVSASGSHQDLEALSNQSGNRRTQPARSGTPPERADASSVPQRRRAAAQTMNFGRSRPDSVVKIAEASIRPQQQAAKNSDSASSRSSNTNVTVATAPHFDQLDDWDDVDGTLLTMQSSTMYSNDDGVSTTRGGDRDDQRKSVTKKQSIWPSEGPIERINETQQLLREKIAERNRRRVNGGGLPVLSLAGLVSDNCSELGSASPSPRAFALLLQRKPKDYVTTTRCAELNRTPLVLPLESVDEFASLIEDVTFLDRQEHVVGRACGTTEGLVLRKTGVMDDAKFAACARILFQCEKLHPQFHEPTQVVVESSEGTQTVFSTEFGAYVIAQVVARGGKR